MPPALANGLTVTEAARAAGCGRSAVFAWRNDDPEFAAEYEAAWQAGVDGLEAEARRRAFEGSDTLLIFLLKQRAPKRFNQKMVEVQVTGSVAVTPPETTGAWIFPRAELDRPLPAPGGKLSSVIEAVIEEAPDPDELEEGEAA
jgi:hypothetical protein